MSGFEIAGIVLAVIPLIVDQIQAYTKGFHTLQSLRTKRYRRELTYRLNCIGNQQVQLQNTLENLLESVVQTDKELSELIQNPRSPLWKQENIQKELQKKLGGNYDRFIANLEELFELLKEISRQLGLEVTDSEAVCTMHSCVPVFSMPLLFFFFFFRFH